MSLRKAQKLFQGNSPPPKYRRCLVVSDVSFRVCPLSLVPLIQTMHNLVSDGCFFPNKLLF